MLCVPVFHHSAETMNGIIAGAVTESLEANVSHLTCGIDLIEVDSEMTTDVISFLGLKTTLSSEIRN